MDGWAEFRARQQEIEREWQWLHDALNVWHGHALSREPRQPPDSCKVRLCASGSGGSDSDQMGTSKEAC